MNPRLFAHDAFASKATGVPRRSWPPVMAGRSLAQQGVREDLSVPRVFVKESVFPFLKLPGTDILLGPEMKSTGEVMGVSEDFWDRIREGAGRRRLLDPHIGHGLHQRQRFRQGRRAAPGALP